MIKERETEEREKEIMEICTFNEKWKWDKNRVRWYIFEGEEKEEGKDI